MQEITTYGNQRTGRIITFYSYKGGVGRSMALANIALLLARMGKKVLAVDWDLEAPGLNRYFSSADLAPAAIEGGLLCLLENASLSHQSASYRDYVHSTQSADFPSIDLLASGDEHSDYGQRVSTFSWADFFREKQGAQWLERLRATWKKDYDFVLIDSRTGITDSGGVCTIQLPDTLVFVVGANQQNLDGCRRIVASIHRERVNLPFDRSRLLILPVLSRFDGREESALAKQWLQKCVVAFQSIFNDWLPKECTPLDVLERTKLPHVARYSFGEELAVLAERESDPDQLPYYYAAIARILESDFREVLDVLGKRNERSEAPPPSFALEAAADAYTAALGLVQKNDIIGWRKLNQKFAAQYQQSIIEWQNARRKNPPTNSDELPKMVLEGISVCAPMIAIALAGVESQQSQFSNQIGLIDEFLHPSGWERSGTTVITQFPEVIVFVYQALLGALAMQTQQAEFAFRLANADIPDAYSNKVEPLFRQTRVTGWPESLNHTCTTAWSFLSQMPDNWGWLLSVFGDANSCRSALGAYYMFLNSIEFLDAIDQGLDLSDERTIRLTVPLNFVALSETNQKKAVRYFKESVTPIALLWREKDLSHEMMTEKWNQWLKICARWAAEVYSERWHWRDSGLPMKELPDLILKSGT